jgi:hypothetical protein
MILAVIFPLSIIFIIGLLAFALWLVTVLKKSPKFNKFVDDVIGDVTPDSPTSKEEIEAINKAKEKLDKTAQKFNEEVKKINKEVETINEFLGKEDNK